MKKSKGAHSTYHSVVCRAFIEPAIDNHADNTLFMFSYITTVICPAIPNGKPDYFMVGNVAIKRFCEENPSWTGAYGARHLWLYYGYEIVSVELNKFTCSIDEKAAAVVATQSNAIKAQVK